MFALQPNPTFKSEITIPVPGGGEGKITFEFRHKSRPALKTFFDGFAEVEGQPAKEDIDALGEIVAGWEGVDGEYSREALAQLLDNYPRAAASILAGYSSAMFEAKEKN